MDNQIKHYIRANENKHIVHGFSTVFEQPLETDICINEDADRHFELLDEVNPPLKDKNGIFRFKQYYNNPTLRTDEDKQPELLIVIRENQINTINIACKKSIESGFEFEGKIYSYAVNPDQVNITKLAKAFDRDSTKIFPIRTKSINRVQGTTEYFDYNRFNLFMDRIEKHEYADNLLKAWELKDKISSAETKEEILAITWE